MGIKQFFFKPYPADFSIKRISFHAWSAFFIVFFILFFIQPFRINELKTIQALKVSFLYACVCVLAIYMVELLGTKLFPKYYDEKNWHILKHILHVLLITVTIAIGNVILSHYLFDSAISLAHVLTFLKYVIIIGVFPITISIFFSQNQYQKKYMRLSNAINEKIEKREVMIEGEQSLATSKIIEDRTTHKSKVETEVKLSLEDEPLRLIGQNNNEYLIVKPSQIVFIEAADNYVAIHFKEVQVKKILLRSTLVLIHQQLNGFDFFIKCHRSFVVNRMYIISTSGNAQGLKLKLKDVETTIPVSRTLTKLFL